MLTSDRKLKNNTNDITPKNPAIETASWKYQTNAALNNFI
jgi:hypothetical protein